MRHAFDDEIIRMFEYYNLILDKIVQHADIRYTYKRLHARKHHAKFL